tara:strand:- start:1719 stop:2546 length:828 start_codon:yes stop_codon:yes gene_type:complete
MPWGQSSYLQQQAAASAAASKKKKEKQAPSSYSGPTTFTSSAAAGGQGSQVQAGAAWVKEKLGIKEQVQTPVDSAPITTDTTATALTGKDKKFYGQEASQLTNEYLVSIGEATQGNPYYDAQGNITGYSYFLTKKGKEMKYGQSGSAMGQGDPTGIMTSIQISEAMMQQQNLIQALALGALSFAAPPLAGTVLKMGAAKAYGQTYQDYQSQFTGYQSGDKTIQPATISEQGTSVDMAAVGGTGVMGDTEITTTKKNKNLAGMYAGKAVKLRKILA